MMENKIIILWISLIFLCLNTNNLLVAQCGNAEHSTNEKDSWLSCESSMNPNSSRGSSHWLQYDLGYIYKMGLTQFWNYNVANLTGRGFKEIAIDYSLDGNIWNAAGTFSLPQASGTLDYKGQEGINLSGVTARYILITALSNWNDGACAGLSEVRFEVHANSSTCGDFIVTQNIGGNDLHSGTYYGDNAIESDGEVKAGSDIIFQSGTSITLKMGFSAKQGSQFLAKIESCNVVNEPENLKSLERESNQNDENNSISSTITLFPNPTFDILNIDVGDMIITEVMVINVSGHELLRRIGDQNLIQIDVAQFPAGMYLFSILTEDQQLISKRFVKKTRER